MKPGVGASPWCLGLLLLLAGQVEWLRGQERVEIVPYGSGGWSSLNPVDGANRGYDPALVDLDFDTTWYDPLGVHLGGNLYDGPVFSAGAVAPIVYDRIPGLPPGGTELGVPEFGTRGSVYLLKTIDGGAHGYHDLEFNYLAYDGCYFYLNGQLAAVGNADPARPGTWGTLVPAPRSQFSRPAVQTRQTWLEPGPNLLAISVHNDDLLSAQLGLSLEIRGVPGPPPPVSIVRQPYLQTPTPDSVTICWRTNHHADSTLSYWTEPGGPRIRVTDPTVVANHAVTLTDLQPGTKYFYSVESRDVLGSTTASEEDEAFHWFRTAPERGQEKPTRIWVIGDSGTGQTFGAFRDLRSRSVFDGYLDYSGGAPPDVWLMLGDNAYSTGTDTQYQEAVFETYQEILGNTAIWPALGNHDAFNTDVYQSIFNLPAAGEAGGMPSGSELYYSFDHGDIHFICLDSASFNTANPFVSTVMYEWLEADLASTDREWIIVYLHHGPYTKGSHDSDVELIHRWIRETAVPILEAHGVDLMLSGHSHCYERSMLINGHYGVSETFNPELMLIDGGNGSDLGSVDEEGRFQEGLGMTGAYEKPSGTGYAGAVYSTVGSSGKLSGWSSGSFDLVNPEPHPVMLVNLLELGSMVIEIEGGRLDAKFLDAEGEVRDDFSIVKGSEVSLEAVDPVFVETGSDDTATFRFARTGATGLPLDVGFTLSGTAAVTVDYVTGDPIGGILSFARGETEREITLLRVPDQVTEGWETVELGLRDSPQYRIAPTAPAATAFLLEESYDGWVLTEFGLSNLGGETAPEDNPDGDRWSNLLEYALGGDPLAQDSGGVLVVRAEGPFLALDYPRDPRREELTYTVEASEDLVHWTPLPVTDSLLEPAGSDGLELRRGLVINHGAGPVYQFLRLRVEMAE